MSDIVLYNMEITFWWYNKYMVLMTIPVACHDNLALFAGVGAVVCGTGPTVFVERPVPE